MAIIDSFYKRSYSSLVSPFDEEKSIILWSMLNNSIIHSTQPRFIDTKPYTNSSQILDTKNVQDIMIDNVVRLFYPLEPIDRNVIDTSITVKGSDNMYMMFLKVNELYFTRDEYDFLEVFNIPNIDMFHMISFDDDDSPARVFNIGKRFLYSNFYAGVNISEIELHSSLDLGDEHEIQPAYYFVLLFVHKFGIHCLVQCVEMIYAYETIPLTLLDILWLAKILYDNPTITDMSVELVFELYGYEPLFNIFSSFCQESIFYVRTEELDKLLNNF